MVRPVRQSIRLESRTASLQLFRAFARHTLEQADLGARLVNHVVLAIDEAITSIVRHADADDRVGEVELDIDVQLQMIAVLVTDSGTTFGTAADTQDLIDRGRALELGVFLIRQIMDQVDYVFRKGKQNRLELVKYLAPDA